MIGRFTFFLSFIASLVLPLQGGIMLSPPSPLGELQYGGAWNRQEYPTSAWTGQHFLTVWVEQQGSPVNRHVIRAARFSAEGDRIDPHGVDLLAGADIRYARVLRFSDSTLLLWSTSEGIHSAVLGEELEITRRETISGDEILAFDAGVLDDRALLSWETHWGGETSIALLSDSGLVLQNATLMATDGYHPRVAASDDGFFVVYVDGAHGSLGVGGQFVSRNGALGQTIEIVPRDAGVSSPSVAFTGEHYLVSYTARFRDDGLRLRTVSTEGELGPETAIGSGHDTTLLSCNAVDCLVVTTYVPEYCRITCVEAVNLAGARVTHEGQLIERGVEAHEVYRNTWPDLASSPDRHFLTWQHSAGWRDDRGRGAFVDTQGMSEDFPLSLSAAAQQRPVSAGDDDNTMIVWTESDDEPFETCLRGTVRSTGAEPIVLDLTPCRPFADVGGGSWEGEYSLSWDGNSWLVTWTEQAGRDTELRGRTVTPGGDIGEPFLIRTHDGFNPPWETAGNETGHLIVWADHASVLATRISSTGLVMEEPFHVVWNEYGGHSGAGYPLVLAPVGNGFVLGWNQYCSNEDPPKDRSGCGLMIRNLQPDGRTFGLPRKIGELATTIDAASSSTGTLLGWAENASVPLSGYDVRLRAVVLDDSEPGESRTVRTFHTDTSDWGHLEAMVHDEGFLLALARDDHARPTTELLALDAHGAPTGETRTVLARIEESFAYNGKTFVVEESYERHAPYHGAPRIFLRTLEDRPPRRRPVRRW